MWNTPLDYSISYLHAQALAQAQARGRYGDNTSVQYSPDQCHIFGWLYALHQKKSEKF